MIVDVPLPEHCNNIEVAFRLVLANSLLCHPWSSWFLPFSLTREHILQHVYAKNHVASYFLKLFQHRQDRIPRQVNIRLAFRASEDHLSGHEDK